MELPRRIDSKVYTNKTYKHTQQILIELENILPLYTIFGLLLYQPNTFKYICYVIDSSLLSYCQLVSCLKNENQVSDKY